MHGVRKTMSEGVQIEKVVVWVEAIPKSMVWKVHKINESFWLSDSTHGSLALKAYQQNLYLEYYY